MKGGNMTEALRAMRAFDIALGNVIRLVNASPQKIGVQNFNTENADPYSRLQIYLDSIDTSSIPGLDEAVTKLNEANDVYTPELAASLR